VIARRRGAGAGWEQLRERTGTENGWNNQFNTWLNCGTAGELDRQLALSDEMADEAMIRRIATRLDGIVGAMRLRRRTHLVSRARQSVQARTAQDDGRVARDQRDKHELTNKPRYHDSVSRSQARGDSGRTIRAVAIPRGQIKYIPRRPVDQFPASAELRDAIQGGLRQIILHRKVPVAAEKFRGPPFLTWSL